MMVYVVIGQDGEYAEDRQTAVVWAGVDEEEAFRIAGESKHDCTFFSVWDAGRELSQYYRDYFKGDHNRDNGSHSKWGRNSGAVIERFEHENTSQQSHT